MMLGFHFQVQRPQRNTSSHKICSVKIVVGPTHIWYAFAVYIMNPIHKIRKMGTSWMFTFSTAACGDQDCMASYLLTTYISGIDTGQWLRGNGPSPPPKKNLFKNGGNVMLMLFGVVVCQYKCYWMVLTESRSHADNNSERKKKLWQMYKGVTPLFCPIAFLILN